MVKMRQIDRQTDKLTDRQTDADRMTDKHVHGQAETYRMNKDRQANIQVYGLIL